MAKTAKAKPKTAPALRRVIYAGTFDPITNGHVDLINRALLLFDEVIVLVAHSRKKSPLFEPKLRKKLIEQCFPNDKRVSVAISEGLLALYAKENGINVVLRGLRGISDFEYEFQMATMNARMNPDLQTFFLMSSEKFFFVNSTLVKEVFSHGGDISELVPPHVEKHLKEILG